MDTPRLPAVTVDPARLASVEDKYLQQCFRPQPAAAQGPDEAVFTRPTTIPRRGNR